MERLLARVLGIVAVGLALAGLVVGLLTTNTGDFCGSVLAHDAGCRQPTSSLAMMLVLWILSATCATAALVADIAAPSRPDWKTTPSSSVRVPRPGELED